MGQVDDHAREEPGLGHAQQEAHPVELPGSLHQGRQRRDDPPGDHDPADPLPGAPLLDEERAGDLQQEIADEEDARHRSRRRSLSKPGRSLVILELGQRHVDPVDVGDHVAEEQQRQQPAIRLGGPVQRDGVGGEVDIRQARSLGRSASGRVGLVPFDRAMLAVVRRKEYRKNLRSPPPARSTPPDIAGRPHHPVIGPRMMACAVRWPLPLEEPALGTPGPHPRFIRTCRAPACLNNRRGYCDKSPGVPGEDAKQAVPSTRRSPRTPWG